MTVREHLDGVFGATSRRLASQGAVDVRFWPDSQATELGVVSTVGMSSIAYFNLAQSATSSREYRTECFSFCRTADILVFGECLLKISDYGSKSEKPLYWWQTLPLGRPLVARSQLDALLLSFPPYSADKVTFVIDGTRRDLVWVIPITNAELTHCRIVGIEAFEQLLDLNEVDVADLYRDSIV